MPNAGRPRCHLMLNRMNIVNPLVILAVVASASAGFAQQGQDDVKQRILASPKASARTTMPSHGPAT